MLEPNTTDFCQNLLTNGLTNYTEQWQQKSQGLYFLEPALPTLDHFVFCKTTYCKEHPFTYDLGKSPGYPTPV